jgi:hypothetical protein
LEINFMEGYMKTKSAILAALFLLTSVASFAAPSPCVPGTLASYIALGSTGCTFEGSVFANFAYLLPPAPVVGVTPDQIMVTPVPGPIIAGFFLGLNFSANWTAGPGELLHAVIDYTVTPPPPVSTISSGTITLYLGTAQISGITGSVNVTQETNVGDLSVYESCTEVCTLKATDQLSFAPIKPLQVTNVLTLNGGSGGVVLKRFAAKYDLCPMCAEPDAKAVSPAQ